MGRMKKGLVVVASMAAISAAASAVGVPAAAAGQRSVAQNAAVPGRAGVARVPGPAPSAVVGYMWSTSVTGGPSSAYFAFDNTGGSISTVAGAPGSGQYTVYFPGLGPASANPTIDITRYGTQGTCSLASVQPSGGALAVGVICNSLAGVPGDALFDMVVAQPLTAPQGVLDYDAVTLLGPQLGPGQYNSSHKTNRVKRLGIGRFQVTMPGPGTTGTTGTVKLSDINITTGNCEIVGWHGTPTGQVIDVDCFSVTGTPQDRDFLITYARGNNLMGLNGVTTADAFANRPTATQYQPGTQYDSHHNARVTSIRLGQGSYQVIFRGSEGPGSLNGGNIQVSAVGHTDDHCYVVSWTQQQAPFAHVACVNNLGAPADSAFTIQWVVA